MAQSLEEIKQGVHDIVLQYCVGKTLDDVAAANTFQDLNLDSVALVSILGDVEEAFAIQLEDDPSIEITLPEFVNMVAERVNAKGA
ncbi:MAG: acyl carrier protein [Proteobacteria bacterium]|nr:acyl carrier protein [Pseudomonadota bacterium]